MSGTQSLGYHAIVMTDQHDPSTVLTFWFQELDHAAWWKGSPELDAQIQQRFEDTLLRAAACELDAWRESAHGRLAEVLVLDQFSRHIYRGQGKAFAQDPLALALSQQAVVAGALDQLATDERIFLLMPWMHSESAAIHQRAVPLFTAHAPANNLDYELRHKAIIDRFGRYPHRNAILGRASSAEELAFLREPGSSF